MVKLRILNYLNEVFDKFEFQLYLLFIWKNIQIYKRNKVRLCLEVIWPLLFVGIAVLMRYNYGDRAYLRQDECHFYSKPLLSAGFFEFLHGYICHFNNTCNQEFVENNNFFANQTSQLSEAYNEINYFMVEEKNSMEDILIQFLTQLGKYDSQQSDYQQTGGTFPGKKLQEGSVKFKMDDFIALHKYFSKILSLPKVKRILRHFQPLLRQFKDWISGNPTLPDDDIIAIIGGMKAICGPKFYLDNEHVEKINVENHLKELLLEPFKITNRDMKNNFCQNLDEEIKTIPMLNKIWTTIKPLFMGKLLFAPRNAATWKIMQHVNSTFERFTFYHKFTRDYIKLLFVAFKKIKDVEGEEAFTNQKINILGFMRHLEMAYKISSKVSEALDCLNVNRIEGFSTESELVDYARSYIDRDTFFAGVVFLDMEDNKKEGPTDNLTSILNFVRYKIRMDSQKIDPTDSLYDDEEPPSPRRHPLTHLKYYYHGFVILQELLDTAITDVSSHNSIFNESYIHKPRVTLQQTPHPCYNRDEFLRSFYWILPLQLCLGWTLTIAFIILNMAEESKKHLHNYYKILGMNDTILILAQLATHVIPIFVSSTLAALILFQGRILLYSDRLAIVMLLFNYGLTTGCLGILFGTLFRKYSVSPYIGITLYLLMTFLPYYMNKAQHNLIFIQKIFMWLVPSVPLLESFFGIIDLEIAQVGLQWDNIVFHRKDTPMSFSDNFIILIFDAILFIGTSILIGMAKTNFNWETYYRIWHIFEKRYLKRVAKQKNEANEDKFIQNDLYMEQEPINSICSIEIKNLTKVIEDGRILDNVSLKFCENQLICILSDNSSTRSTLISMIMRLQHQDSGNIYIHGTNNGHLKHVHIGYMPTYDIAIDELTVEENIWFYTKLKDSEKNIKIKDIEAIMKLAHLYDFRYTLAHQLSLNLNRRLCVAIAFVGKCDIVLLQDPFSGLDAFSKHVLCDMLADYKTGRTIVLTTNDINNARIISDKIAIINEGRLLCCGSKTFLRTIFTKGFELNIEIDNIDNLISMTKKFKFLNLPENFKIDIKDRSTDISLTTLFHKILIHFIPNSYFVEKQGQRYKFVLPYILKDEIYDRIGNNLGLKKLFCFLDGLKNQTDTLRYIFTTISINEITENIKLYEESNFSTNKNTFLYDEIDSVKLFHTSTHIAKNELTTSNIVVDYSILSSDSLSEHSTDLKQYINILITRFKRNYRNYKFGVQIFLIPFLILFFATIWIKLIQTPQIIYPTPYNILLYPDDAIVLAKGLKFKAKDNLLKSVEEVGDQTLGTIVGIPITLYVKSIGNKCVYLMEYTNTDFSGCEVDNIACYITTISNNLKTPIGLGYRYIYENIISRLCQAQKNINKLKFLPKIVHKKKGIFQSKCLCHNRDGKLNCPGMSEEPKMFQSRTLYNVKKVDHIASLPAYLPLYISETQNFIGVFETLLKNDSNNTELKKEPKYKLQEFIVRVMQNHSILSLRMKTLYLNQMHHFKYLSHIPNDSIKIWFNVRLKFGMPSLLSIYDTAYFRTITVLKNNVNYSLSSNLEITDPINVHPLDSKQLLYSDTPKVKYIEIYGGKDYGVITINHPIYSSFKKYLKLNSIVYIYVIIFVQICVTSLITTLILRDMFEETHNYPHIFQLQKVKPLLQFLLNILYNFGLYILAVNVCLLVYIINLKYGELDHFVLILYALFGWALIPFVLTLTYMCPKCSMLDLIIINNGIGFSCLLLEFILNLIEFRNMTSVMIMTFLIPHYGFEKILFILIGSSICQYDKKSDIQWEYMINIFSAFIISGIFYYVLIYCCEQNIVKKAKEMLNKYLRELKIFNYLNIKMTLLRRRKPQEERFNLQKNILKVKNIKSNKIQLVELQKREEEISDPSLYPILIKNLTTSHFCGINIQISNGCCLGLFGMNSGIKPFIRLLTGESIPFLGEIYILGNNIKMNRSALPSYIGFAPKDIYLNTYLTPKECLEFYAGQKYTVSAKSKKVTDFLINHFNIKDNKWIKDCSESTKRKILFAIALMLNPPILVIIEPFKGMNILDTSIVEKTIMDMISMKRCILIISDNVKNCTCYSKLGLFADKNLKFFGPMQNLRTRYAESYMVSIEFNKDRQTKFPNNICDLLVQRLKGTFHLSQIMEYHMSYMEILIYSPNLLISRIYITLEAVRNLYDIYDYSIRTVPLDDILSRLTESNEDFFKDITTQKRPCDLPYAYPSF